MTDEELDKARAEEARRRRGPGSPLVEDATIAARLAREGWTPPPVDPDLLAVREIVAEWWDGMGSGYSAREVRAGRCDMHDLIKVALAAYKAGKEAAR
jgi:hypothetical protein